MAFHDEAYVTLIYVPLVLRLFALTPIASTTFLNLRPLIFELTP